MPVADRLDTAPPPARGPDPYRVMIVEDSLVIRGLLARMVDADPDMQVVTTVSNGKLAVEALARHDVEIVVLDIEMPVMDGLTALPLLLRADPRLQVVMASTLTQSNAEISLKAMAAGAADYIPKPSSSREVGGAADFRREFLEKIRALGATYRRRHRRPRPVSPPAAGGLGPTSSATRQQAATPAFKLMPPIRRVPTVLAIGSSTGGPQALLKIFAALGKTAQPVLVTQHMPPTFTAILAEHVAKVAAMPCAEAVHGETVTGGRIYIAPGDRHLTVGQRDGRKVVLLDDGPKENFCRPSVDPMLRSLAAAYGDGVLATILTGMGQDGAAGCRAVVVAGGAAVAQDEATSVVWGMPGMAAKAGVCSAVLPLDEIAGFLAKTAAGSKR